MEAPFYIGQKVVCIKEYVNAPQVEYLKDFVFPVKNKTYTIRRMEFDPSRNKWFATVSEIKNPIKRFDEGYDEPFFECAYFAPIQTHYTDATSEILEKFKATVEAPDKIIINEPINQ